MLIGVREGRAGKAFREIRRGEQRPRLNEIEVSAADMPTEGSNIAKLGTSPGHRSRDTRHPRSREGIKDNIAGGRKGLYERDDGCDGDLRQVAVRVVDRVRALDGDKVGEGARSNDHRWVGGRHSWSPTLASTCDGSLAAVPMSRSEGGHGEAEPDA